MTTVTREQISVAFFDLIKGFVMPLGCSICL